MLLFEKFRIVAFPFRSNDIDIKELEKIISDAVKKNNPADKIKKIKYIKGGVVVTLNNGEKISIDIDWDEIVLS
jgi:coenzyme F420-reducing hydrogenase beta subunit